MKKGIFKLVILLQPNMTYSKEKSYISEISPTELRALSQECQLSEAQAANIYTDSWYTFGVVMIWGCYGNKGVFLCPLGSQ